MGNYKAIDFFIFFTIKDHFNLKALQEHQRSSAQLSNFQYMKTIQHPKVVFRSYAIHQVPITAYNLNCFSSRSPHYRAETIPALFTLLPNSAMPSLLSEPCTSQHIDSHYISFNPEGQENMLKDLISILEQSHFHKNYSLKEMIFRFKNTYKKSISRIHKLVIKQNNFGLQSIKLKLKVYNSMA